MKAAVCHEFGKPLVIEDLDLDPPQQGEVQVKLSACAICHSDIHYMEGAWGGKLPSVYGHEAAGVVEQVGPGVSSIKPGDHVVVTLLRSCGKCFYCEQAEPQICEAKFPIDKQGRLHTRGGGSILQGLRTGAFAEQVVVDQSQLVVIPESIPLASASLIACGVITGVGAVINTARIPSASSVVVIGTGGVGLNSIQGAALSGASPVIGIDLVASKLEAAKRFGATDAISPGETDARDFVRSKTGGRGADYVLVTVGSTKAIEQAFGLARRGGTVVIVGMPASGAKAEFEPVNFADASQRLLGSKMGSTRLRVDVPKLVALYQQGRLKLDELVSKRYPIESINEAIAEVKQGEVLRNVIEL